MIVLKSSVKFEQSFYSFLFIKVAACSISLMAKSFEEFWKLKQIDIFVN